jgi:hypothetical protein
MVVFGAAFVLKFILLASLYDPAAGLTRRVLTTLLEGATLGGLSYEPHGPATGYLAFLTIALYLVGVFLLPQSPDPGGTIVAGSRRGMALASRDIAALERRQDDEQVG